MNVNEPGQLAGAWEAALSASTPMVLDVLCDPNVPPIPPKVTSAQVKDTASALLHGDEDAWGVLKQGVRQRMEQYLPGGTRTP
jgi:pyruvate dehydrogenase (quinone)